MYIDKKKAENTKTLVRTNPGQYALPCQTAVPTDKRSADRGSREVIHPSGDTKSCINVIAVLDSFVVSLIKKIEANVCFNKLAKVGHKKSSDFEIGEIEAEKLITIDMATVSKK